MLDESVSLVRFWSNSFPMFIRPARNAKGNRLFSPADVETFKLIHFLIRDCGMTLEGAARHLKEDRRPVESKVRAIQILKEIRQQLVQVRDGL